MPIFGNKKGGKHTNSSKHSNDAAESRRRASSDAGYDYAPEYREDSSTTYGIGSQRVEKPKKKKKTRKVILIILIILALLLVGAYAAIELLTEAPDTDVVGPNGETEIVPGVTNGRYNGMYTFMVVGLDRVANNTDTIMVGCLNVVDGELNVINIPRDTLVNTGYNVKKINCIYPACVNNGKDGIAELKAEIEAMLGFGIDNYVVVDIQAAADIVDAIGGVEFDVPVDMYYEDPEQDLYINISAGMQKLNGDNAVKVFRFRNTYAGGDIQRIGVQQDLLKAIATQLLTLGNIPNIGEVINIVENNMETNLTANNIRFYLKEFLLLDKDNINFITMPGNTFGSIFGMSYVFPYIDEWIDLVNEKINPWETKVGVDNINMVTYENGNFYSTTGELKGGVTSFMFYQSGTSVAGAGVYQYTSHIDNKDG